MLASYVSYLFSQLSAWRPGRSLGRRSPSGRGPWGRSLGSGLPPPRPAQLSPPPPPATHPPCTCGEGAIAWRPTPRRAVMGAREWSAGRPRWGRPRWTSSHIPRGGASSGCRVRQSQSLNDKQLRAGSDAVMMMVVVDIYRE